jgi:hypothetical protein
MPSEARTSLFLGISRNLSIAFAAALVAGCGGAGGGGSHDAVPLVPQSVNRAVSAQAVTGKSVSAQQEDTLFPKSVSPASFKPVPMQKTAILPAGQVTSAASGITPDSIGALHFTQLSGDSSRVAVAPDGSIWALSDQPKGNVNKNVWHYVKGTWTNISGNGSRIAVGPTGTVYVVNGTTGDLWSWNGKNWVFLGGGARTVTTGSDGAVYILSNVDLVDDDSAIWKYLNGTWTQINGSGSQLANSFDPKTYTIPGVGTIAPKGFFLLNSAGENFYYSPGTGYVQFPGESSGVAAVPGGLFALNYPSAAGGEGFSFFDYATGLSTAQTGKAVLLASGPGSGGNGTQLDEVSVADLVSTASVVTASPTPSPTTSP